MTEQTLLRWWPRISLRRLSLIVAARRQRKALAELDDAQLADIGLGRDAAEKEAARWDVPPNWRHLPCVISSRSADSAPVGACIFWEAR